MILTSVGSILVLLRIVSHALVNGAADYSLNNDMMTRLYSMNKSDTH